MSHEASRLNCRYQHSKLKKRMGKVIDWSVVGGSIFGTGQTGTTYYIYILYAFQWGLLYCRFQFNAVVGFQTKRRDIPICRSIQAQNLLIPPIYSELTAISKQTRFSLVLGKQTQPLCFCCGAHYCMNWWYMMGKWYWFGKSSLLFDAQSPVFAGFTGCLVYLRETLISKEQ